jgi:predicted lipoprotein with Yx(FWY)xxD motif
MSSQMQSRTHTRSPRFFALTLLVGGVLALAGCGGSSSTTGSSTTSSSSPASTSSSANGYGKSAAAASTPAASTSVASTSAAASVQVSTKTISGLGTVLVNAQGRTLYMFTPDSHAKVTCLSSCASIWPPAKLSSGQKATASGEAKPSLLSSDPDPEGGDVVTYAGWPLYTYAADSGPGAANGQGVSANGGLWYVLSPSGKMITKAP